MVHTRIASDLRSHFSTVGPSPRSESSFPDSHSIAAPNRAKSDGSSRLVLLPNPSTPSRPDDSGARQRSATVFHDVLAASAHRCAAFFAEAAVLVLVLGILDRFLLKERIEFGWIAGSFLVALALLAASIATDVSARRWLRAH